jgi:hypothetical protein
VIEHIREARALESKDSEFGKQLLLANAQTKCTSGQILGFFNRLSLNEGFAVGC